MKKKIKICIFGIIGFFLTLKFIGILLDNEVERAIYQEYLRDENGIIKKGSPRIYKNSHQQSLVFLIGHMDTPQKFYEIYDIVKKDDNLDLYIPNIPFHSTNIENATKLDNSIVSDYIESFLNNLSKEYKKVTVVALSYSGLIMAKLLSEGRVPSNIDVTLYSPAVYIKNNNWINYWSTYLLPKIFREYYNYDLPPILPTGFPVYESGDEKARLNLATEVKFRYRIFRALRKLFELDRETRGVLTKIKQPFKILMARDDNRVPHDKLKAECTENTFCEFISFPSGKHVLHFGDMKERFYKTVSDIALYKKGKE